MSKKVFTLIKGDSVHIAPRTKVLSADAISSMLNAKELLDVTEKDAEKYKREIVKEVEQAKEIAQKEGFEEGFKKWAQLHAELEEEIKKVRKEIQSVVLPVALKAAKKMVSRELELAPEAIMDIVSTSLKAVAQHKHVTIYVNRKDYELIESNRPKLKQLFENVETLSIREKSDVEIGGCIIETEAGIINAQLDNRWRILEAAFETLKKA